MNTAKGTFDLKMTPQPSGDEAHDAAVGRYLLDKTYHGGISGPSLGEMLGSGSPGTGSAGYVAIERITGTLDGRAGSFALMHKGVMHGGQFSQIIEVVPGSGTDELIGISGALTIDVREGEHFYELEYSLP